MIGGKLHDGRGYDPLCGAACQTPILEIAQLLQQSDQRMVDAPAISRIGQRLARASIRRCGQRKRWLQGHFPAVGNW